MPITYLDVKQVINKRKTLAPHNRSRTGYGSKIPTQWLLQLSNKRWHRVYVICYSNSGSAYIATKAGKLFLGSYDLNFAIKKCVLCGQECLANGRCYCGATPVN